MTVTDKTFKKVVDAYVDYKRENFRIKNAQRAEREAKLNPYMADIGRAVVEARAAGATMTDLASAVGTRNRNFLYDAKRAYDALNYGQADDAAASAANAGSEPESEPEDEFLVLRTSTPGVYTVDLADGETYTIKAAIDGLVLPPGWLTDPLPLYRKIIKQVSGMAHQDGVYSD